MRYDDIFLFVKLINTGTFLALSKSLNLTQSTISKRIKKLEDDLGLQLIRRNSRGRLEMTQDGEILYNNFNNHEQTLKNSLELVTKQQDKINGVIYIAVPLIVYNKVLLPYLHEFRTNFPQAKLVVSYTGNQIELLKDGVDLAVSMHQPKSQNTKIKLLKKSKIKLFASQNYVEQYGAPTLLNELAKHNVAGRSLDKYLINELQATNIHTDKDHIVHCESSIYINNANYNIDMATSSDFIISIAEMFVAQDIEAKLLVPILPDYYFGNISFYLLRGNEIHGKLEQVAAEFIQDCFNRTIFSH